jgi:hypothetical protein
MSSRDLHVFGGSLLTCPYARSCFSAAQLSCLMLCFFGCSKIFLRERVYAFLLHNLSGDISCFWGRYEISLLMSCHAFRPWWDVVRFPHFIWCFVWPPMRLLCFYLMRCYAVLLHNCRVRLPHEIDFVMRFHIVEGSWKIVLWDVILVDPPTRFPRSILLLFAA